MLGGDDVRFSVTAGAQSAAQVTTQSAERVYRSLGPECCVAIELTVGAGAQLARFQLFNADTTSSLSVTDLDLDVFNGPDGTGVNVGSSGGGSSDELVMLTDPTPGTYSACVTGFAVGTGATYALSTWVVGPAVGVQTLRASAPRKVYVGGAGTVALAWSVPAGKRYLGKVTFVNNTDPAAPVPLSSSIVFVDNH